MTHLELIRDALKAGRVLTGADCVDRKLGERIMNYKGRMHDLRRQGINIPKDARVKYKGHEFAIYYDADLMSYEEAVQRKFPDMNSNTLRDTSGRFSACNKPATKEVLDKAVVCYKAGATFKDVRVKFPDVSWRSLYRGLKKRGVLRHRGQHKQLDLGYG